MWDAADEDGTIARLARRHSRFDVILVADCLFFKVRPEGSGAREGELVTGRQGT
jgi:hypothetical protein